MLVRLMFATVRDVVTSYSFKRPLIVLIAARAETTAITTAIQGELKRAGIVHLAGEAAWQGVPRIDYPASDRNAVRAAITVATKGKANVRYLVRGKILRGTMPRTRRFDVAIIHHIQAHPYAVVISKIELAEWDDRKTSTGKKVAPDIPHPRVMTATSAEEALRYEPAPYPDGKRHQFPIDIVYTWVDDADPHWAAARAKWAALQGGSKGATFRANHNERFKNRDELRYSLRSLEMFAPWVNRIHIVTADQTPSWLNLEHPKINLVRHKDIFDSAHLPTFNSSAIETRLHHIPGLTEHFVYFNDDVFLGCPCDAADFFYPNGLSRFYFSVNTAIPEMHDGDVEEYLQADFNAILLFREHLGFSPTHIMEHVPHPGRRSVITEMERMFPEQFRACAESKFRSSVDLRPLAFMYPHYAFHKQLAVPGEMNHRYLALWKPRIKRQLRGVLKSRRYKTFCINDVGLTDEREEEINCAVAAFLEAYFPLKSEFEK